MEKLAVIEHLLKCQAYTENFVYTVSSHVHTHVCIGTAVSPFVIEGI